MPILGSDMLASPNFLLAVELLSVFAADGSGDLTCDIRALQPADENKASFLGLLS